MATTTNYGWTTPDDTALVKDGASAIRTLGTAIDTTTFNNAAAAIAKTIVDAKGDIIVATAADTVSRLAVGANDTVLVADSAQATGVKWATPASGGMTLLSTTTMSGSSTVSITGINQTYNTLYVVAFGVGSSAAFNFTIEFNSTNPTQANQVRTNNSGTSTATISNFGNQNAVAASNTSNIYVLTAHNYASTTSIKNVQQNYFAVTAAQGNESSMAAGTYNSTSAITSFRLVIGSGTFNAGTILTYGVK